MLIFIGTAILVIFLVLLSLTLVLGFAIFIGWVLTFIFPFTLFEGSVLGIIASIVVGSIWANFFDLLPKVNVNDYEEVDEDEVSIPATRFYKRENQKTWTNWLRYQLANGIYVEFIDAPTPVVKMNNPQLQELAIRLGDLAIDMLKDRPAQLKQLHITQAALRQQMSKAGLRPYDNKILKVAVSAINEDLDYYQDDILSMMQTNGWNEACELLD